MAKHALEVYRVDNLACRSGEPRGAKGEVTSLPPPTPQQQQMQQQVQQQMQRQQQQQQQQQHRQQQQQLPPPPPPQQQQLPPQQFGVPHHGHYVHGYDHVQYGSGGDGALGPPHPHVQYVAMAPMPALHVVAPTTQAPRMVMPTTQAPRMLSTQPAPPTAPGQRRASLPPSFFPLGP